MRRKDVAAQRPASNSSVLCGLCPSMSFPRAEAAEASHLLVQLSETLLALDPCL